MKKIILLLSIICMNAKGQTCSYAINDVDKFNGKTIKQTKLAHIVKKFNVKVGVCMQHYGDEYYFILTCNYGEVIGGAGSIDVKKGQELILLLDNNEKIILKNYADRSGVISKHSCALNFVTYLITPDQLKQLAKQNVTDLRYDRVMNGSVSFDNFELEKKDQAEIQELIKCIL